ncbi:MAG TPA: hypothetical protein VLS93_04115 [Anaeromyxobacteraceae bacterium]|nr:hypothetical protein [Anaeromyxobacteraceae bacterium]
MIRALLTLLLALGPVASEGQEAGGAGPAVPGEPAQASRPEGTDPVTVPRPPEGLLAFEPPATLGGVPTRLVASAGATVAGGSGLGARAGLTAGLTLVRERLVLVQSLEVARRETLVLAGGGGVLPLPRRFHLVASCLGGLHATGGPIAILPAVGVRTELGWTTRPSRAIVHYLSVSLTGLADLAHAVSPAGEKVGGVRVALAITAGFTLEPRRQRS